MIFSRFFKTAKPKSFSYKPRYYDERKDRIEELKQQIRKVNGEEAEGSPEASRIREGFEFRRSQRAVTQPKFSNSRIIIIALAISLLVYYLLYK